MKATDGRAVPGFPGYTVLDNGVVMSVRSRYRRRVDGDGSGWYALKPQRSGKGGHLKVRLYSGMRDDKGQRVWKDFLLHRLVLELFVGPCPEGMECCHGDGDPANNCLSNLRWDTTESNMKDRDLHGTTARGEKSGAAVLTEEQVKSVRERSDKGESLKGLAKEFSVHPAHISKIVKGKLWAHLEGHDQRDHRHNRVIHTCECGRQIRGCAFFLHRKSCPAVVSGESK